MQDPQKLIERFKSRVHVLDGGLATELEKRGHDISGKLWSAQVLLDDPGAIEQLHYDYLKAGADIIITSSYQLTFQGMKEAGYTHQQAEDALWKSVEVAVKARDRYLSELDEEPPEDHKPLIAASIGPYGAYLADGSEYTGEYGRDHPNLAEFHKERFETLSESDADFIAMETIPSEFEADNLVLLANQYPQVPYSLTFATREHENLAGGGALGVAGVYVIREAGDQLIAFGANCLSPSTAKRVVQEVAGLNDFFDPNLPYRKQRVPIIVYPNSGEGWDAEHRCWVGENDAEHFAEFAREWIKAGANIIGGCCRTGPEHIAQLRKLVDSM